MRTSGRRFGWLAAVAGCVGLLVTALPSAAVSAPSSGGWQYDFTSFGFPWRVADGWNCSRPDDVSVSGGDLRLEVAPGGTRSCPLVGAHVDTYHQRSFAPGTFSARIRFSMAPGSWETFWLTGANGLPWPARGEIDIAETLGSTPGTLYLRLHSGARSNPQEECSEQAQVNADIDDEWHTYSVTTSSTAVLFELDGRPVAVMHPNLTCTWPFDGNQNVLLSDWGGQGWAGPAQLSDFPVTMQVAWFSWQPLNSVNQ